MNPAPARQICIAAAGGACTAVTRITGQHATPAPAGLNLLLPVPLSLATLRATQPEEAPCRYA